jgi:hypothetical protein
MTGIQHILRDLMSSRVNYEKSKCISKTSYRDWQKLYTWEALTNQRYGQSFCRHFDISDNRLWHEREWARCDTIIQDEYLARS